MRLCTLSATAKVVAPLACASVVAVAGGRCSVRPCMHDVSEAAMYLHSACVVVCTTAYRIKV
jgi:hypothetical protein